MGKFEKRNVVFYKNHVAIIEEVVELEEFPWAVIYKIQTSIYGPIEVFEEDLSLPPIED